MRYPQGGGLTPERQQFREELLPQAAERFTRGETSSAIAKDLRVSVSGGGGAGFRLRAQAAAGKAVAPVIWSQIAKRMVISARKWAAVIRWRRGLKWG